MSMNKSKRPAVLLVEDESAIRETLGMILKQNGFDVTTAASVGEALSIISRRSFDALLSDLNIGQPGDGFTVASAVRRRWPKAATVILTGYPDFEAALEAIRKQVDDYVIKPVEPEELVKLVREKLQTRAQANRPLPSKRVADVIRDSKEHIIAEWLKATKSHPEFQSPMSDDERRDHLPNKLDELVAMLESRNPHETSRQQLRAAFMHGETRKQQGYSAEMIVEETRLVETCIFNTVQANLLNINISRIIPDLILITDSSQRQLRQTLHAFLGDERVTEIRGKDDKKSKIASQSWRRAKIPIPKRVKRRA